MRTELWTLIGAIVLGLIHVSAASMTFKAEVGNAYTVGARDEERRPTRIAGRLDRALRNFNETFPLFAALVLLVHVTGCSGGWSESGALLDLGGRTLYLPAYASGLPWVRTICWNVATLGLALVLVEVDPLRAGHPLMARPRAPSARASACAPAATRPSARGSSPG